MDRHAACRDQRRTAKRLSRADSAQARVGVVEVVHLAGKRGVHLVHHVVGARRHI